MVGLIEWCLIADRKYAEMTPSFDTLLMMEMFVQTLAPFHLLTDAMSAEKSVSVSSMWKLLSHIKQVCNTEISGDIPENMKAIATTIRSAIWKYIDERYVYVIDLEYQKYTTHGLFCQNDSLNKSYYSSYLCLNQNVA